MQIKIKILYLIVWYWSSRYGGKEWKIKPYIELIRKLKLNPDIVKKYEELKRSLDGSTEEEYKKEKNKFLKEYNLT